MHEKFPPGQIRKRNLFHSFKIIRIIQLPFLAWAFLPTVIFVGPEVTRGYALLFLYCRRVFYISQSCSVIAVPPVQFLKLMNVPNALAVLSDLFLKLAFVVPTGKTTMVSAL